MKTKTFLWINLIIVASLALSACSAVNAGSPASAEASTGSALVEDASVSSAAAVLLSADTLGDLLPGDYPDALSARNQLALGTLRLEGSAHAVTPEQAQTLAFLWQGFRALSGSATTAGEEIAAMQQEIMNTLTAGQLEAIRAMQLTSADLNAFYAERGIPMPTVNPDNPDAVPGAQRGRDMTPEERAAWRAEREASGEHGGGGGGGGGAGVARRDALLDAVIALLLARAG